MVRRVRGGSGWHVLWFETRQMRSTLLVGTALVSVSVGLVELSAQEVTLDEGTFTIYEGSNEVGTETFSIRQSGEGSELRIVAGSRIHIVGGTSPRDIQTTLELRGAERRLALYAVKVGGATPLDVRYSEDGPSRLSMVRRTEAGERAREMRAPQGLTVLDAGVAHHLFFLRQRLQGGASEVAVLVPMEGETGRATLRDQGSQSVEVGGNQVSAQRVDITTGAGVLSAWFDDRGRLLRMQRGSSFSAVRTQLP